MLAMIILFLKPNAIRNAMLNFQFVLHEVKAKIHYQRRLIKLKFPNDSKLFRAYLGFLRLPRMAFFLPVAGVPPEQGWLVVPHRLYLSSLLL